MFEAQLAVVRALRTYLVQAHIGMNADAYRLRMEYGMGLIGETEFRLRMAEIQTRWGSKIYQAAAGHLALTVDFDLPEQLPGSYIVVSNHRQTLDVAFLFRVLALMGLTRTRWVIKSQLRYLPVIGSMALDGGGVFVRRSRDPEDLARLQVGAELASQEGAGMLLFPEGTRFRPERVRGTRWRHVMPPKRMGFDVIRRAMPTAPVLVVTIDWRQPPTDKRTMFEAGSFYRAPIAIKARYASAQEVDAHPDWLTETWAQMDEVLARS